jgi:predicted small lipoprotein YifL
MKFKLIFVLFLLSLGCGIKGPPLPPLDTMERVNNAGTEEQTASANAASTDSTQKIKTK